MHARLILAMAVVLAAGCQTPAKPEARQPGPTRAGTAEMRKLQVAGAKLGDSKAVLRRFPQAKRVPGARTGEEVFEVYKPNSQISILRLHFREGRLRRMELRYFNGPTEQTLRSAGGWDGLRDILIKRFGPPVKAGPGVPVLASLSLPAAYARFNGVWDFPKIYRQMHYIALSDAKGGVGVITFIDTTPASVPGPTPATSPSGPNPGF